MTTKRVCAVSVLALIAVFPIRYGILSAHHSKAHYASDDKQRTWKGTVVEYKWRNPHVYVVWDSTEDSGKVIRWTGELSSVTTSIADGLKKDSLKTGDEVLILAVPSKTGAPETLIHKITRDGKVILDLTRENIRASDR
jgi:hypothetical protein